MVEYKEILTKAVKTEFDIVGENALKIARSVDGLNVDDEGNVISYQGEGVDKLNEFIEKFMDFSPVSKYPIKNAVKPFFEKNPDLEKPDILK